MATVLKTTNTVFRAFADENRTRLLNLRLEGEVCVCDLCVALDMRQPRISRPLAYLPKAGLAAARQKGKWKHYAAAKHPAELHRRLLNCVRTSLGTLTLLETDLARLEQPRGRGCCIETR